MDAEDEVDDVKDIVEVLRQFCIYFSTFCANLSFLITMFFMTFYEVDYVKDIVEVLPQDLYQLSLIFFRQQSPIDKYIILDQG